MPRRHEALRFDNMETFLREQEVHMASHTVEGKLFKLNCLPYVKVFTITMDGTVIVYSNDLQRVLEDYNHYIS